MTARTATAADFCGPDCFPTVAGSHRDCPDTAPVRSSALDRIRGAAIALMVVDHVALFAQAAPVRLTLGRLALPLFFILAGHLAHRLSRRHLIALAVGAALPVVSPWVDSPNVLLWWALGSGVLVLARQLEAPAWVSPAFFIALALTFSANTWTVQLGTSYDPFALLALMSLGALLPRSSFAWGDRLPAFLAHLGRRPLTLYVGHVLVLSVINA